MIWKKLRKIKLFRTLRFRLAATFLLLLIAVMTVFGIAGARNLREGSRRIRVKTSSPSSWVRA